MLSGAAEIEIRDLGRCAYDAAIEVQRQVHERVRSDDRPGVLLLVEHDPVVTLGRRGERGGILDPDTLRLLGIDVLESERGGDVTYHGPGQLVAYPVLRIRDFGLDVRSYVIALEGVVLRVLQGYAIEGRRDPEMHGVFTPGGKIASVGVYVSRGVTRHGVSLNVDPDDAHWQCIAPCGQAAVRASSLRAELKAMATDKRPPGPIGMDAVRERFVEAFAKEFGVEVRPEAKSG